jgi:hypothetical protein
VAERKSFLVRLPADLLDELNRWAGDELRSLNAQIEYVLRDAVRKRRTFKSEDDPDSRMPSRKFEKPPPQ